MQTALAPRLCRVAAPGRRQPLSASRRPWTTTRSLHAAGLALRAAAEGQKDRHRLVADTESEEELDPDSDIPMSQRLTARDTFREMSNMPPEYPPEPEAYDPDKHRTVDEMVSDADEMLPDDPVGLDEEIITDTKPFIQDLYNETAGVIRKAPPSSAASAASNVDAVGHSSGAVGNRPSEGGTAMSVGGPWPGPVSNLPRGGATFMSAGSGNREQRKAEAEAEATDMKHGAGQKERSKGQGGSAGGSGGSSGASEGERIVPEGGAAAAKGGCSPVTGGIGDKPQPVSGAVAVRGAAKAQQAQRAAAAKSLQQGGGLSEGGPGMADRLVAEAAAERKEGREEAGSEKGAAGGGGTGSGASGTSCTEGQATSRTTSAQDVGGASGAAGSIEKEAAAQGKEGGKEDDEDLPGWGGSGTIEDRRARRRALEQMGGDRPERAGLTLFLDKQQRE